MIPEISRRRKKKVNLGIYLIPSTKINSKWIIGLHVKYKLTFLEKNIGENLDNLGFGKKVLRINTKSTAHEKKIVKFDIIIIIFNILIGV